MNSSPRLIYTHSHASLFEDLLCCFSLLLHAVDQKFLNKMFPFLAKSFLSDLLQNHVSHILSDFSFSLLFNFFLAFFFYVDQRYLCSIADGDMPTSSAFSYSLAPCFNFSKHLHQCYNLICEWNVNNTYCEVKQHVPAFTIHFTSAIWHISMWKSILEAALLVWVLILSIVIWLDCEKSLDLNDSLQARKI